MSKRKNPTAKDAYPAVIEQDKHERMLSEMHDALYSLGSKIRKPMVGSGEKMLPKDLQSSETPEAKAARQHVELLHGQMKSAKR